MKITLLKTLIISLLISLASCSKDMESGSTNAELNAQQLLLAIQSRPVHTDFAQIFRLAENSKEDTGYNFVTDGYFVIGRNFIAVEDFDTGNTTTFDLSAMIEFSFTGYEQNTLSIYLE